MNGVLQVMTGAALICVGIGLGGTIQERLDKQHTPPAAIVTVYASATPRPTPKPTARPKPKPVLVVTPAKVVALMHRYCASLGYQYADSNGVIGDPDTQFGCSEGDPGMTKWYWFRWGDVKNDV